MEPLGVYIHIPFCERKCGYCDFYSVVVRGNPEPLWRRFVDALKAEISLRCREWAGLRRISTIYMGGGTPSLLPGKLFADIVGALAAHFDLTALQEFTVEVNPGTANREKLALYRSLQVDRLSIGAQAFQDRLLRRLQRIHTAEQTAASVALAHSLGYTNISLDLMFGIPGQDFADWKNSLGQAVALGPRHLSVYNLTYEAGTPFYRNLQNGHLKPVSDVLEKELYLYADRLLADAGFLHYEISNYALPGKECRHNLGYWNGRPYLGFGPSAHSFDGERRWWNAADLAGYIENLRRGMPPPGGGERLSSQARREEWLFLRMRQRAGIRKEEFRRRTAVGWEDFLARLQSRLGPQWSRFFRTSGNGVSFTTEGFWFSDELLARMIKLLEELSP